MPVARHHGYGEVGEDKGRAREYRCRCRHREVGEDERERERIIIVRWVATKERGG